MRWVGAMKPTAISGIPKRVVSDAIRKSQASASSAPLPMHAPVSIATVANGNVSISANSLYSVSM